MKRRSAEVSAEEVFYSFQDGESCPDESHPPLHKVCEEFSNEDGLHPHSLTGHSKLVVWMAQLVPGGASRIHLPDTPQNEQHKKGVLQRKYSVCFTTIHCNEVRRIGVEMTTIESSECNTAKFSHSQS